MIADDETSHLEGAVEGKVIGEYRPNAVDRLLTPEMADPTYARRVKHFLEAVEAAILEANSAVMRESLPSLDRDTFLRLAVRVAELRADYVKFGLALAAERHPSPAHIQELADRRQAFEEMAALVEATQRLVERGYSLVG
jgi:hypothetical protein